MILPGYCRGQSPAVSLMASRKSFVKSSGTSKAAKWPPFRCYTVPSPAAARKSTIVAIAAIGFFYALTLFMGLGAMTGGVVNPVDVKW